MLTERGGPGWGSAGEDHTDTASQRPMTDGCKDPFLQVHRLGNLLHPDPQLGQEVRMETQSPVCQ